MGKKLICDDHAFQTILDRFFRYKGTFKRTMVPPSPSHPDVVEENDEHNDEALFVVGMGDNNDY